MITQDVSLTFAQAWERGVRFANGLLSMGIRPGDRVAGLEDNVLGCADSFVGCAIAGAVRVPLYPRSSREAHGHMLAGTDCVVVVTDESHAAGVADDWFVIRHSGGTTGKPKGVGYTHHDWVLNCRNWAYSLERMRRDSVIGHAAPISHASGYLFLPAWPAGAATLLFGVFEPEKECA